MSAILGHVKVGPRASRKSELAVSARPAVSLVEVLVVFAIIALMLALLVPGLNHARERARRLVCANNLHQMGVACHCYRNEHNDYLPTEGTYWDLDKPYTWFNVLPPYLGLPPYVEFEGANVAIRELPNIHVWICPSKNVTKLYKSKSGMNQFHYGMNQVLDGLGSEHAPSHDTPGFLDQGDDPIRAHLFDKKPNTVFMFDIAPNSPAGTPRGVATKYQRWFDGEWLGKFHGDYANILYLDGRVGNCVTDDLVTDRDFRHGDIIWTNPKLYWGYPRPSR